jgi:hypothetical protein
LRSNPFKYYFVSLETYIAQGKISGAAVGEIGACDMLSAMPTYIEQAAKKAIDRIRTAIHMRQLANAPRIAQKTKKMIMPFPIWTKGLSGA